MPPRLIAAILAALLLPAAASAAAPGWCSASRLNATEQTICADPVLGALDQRLNRAFRAAQEVTRDLGQGAWLRLRNTCGRDVTCLETTYGARIAELRAIADLRRDDPERPRILPLPEEGPVVEPPLTADPAPGPGGGLGGAYADLPALDGMLPRPWCDARRLNRTERTICADPELSRLDALLQITYGRLKARDGDRAQIRWLRGFRDACGSDRLCIALAYTNRIRELREPLARLNR